MSVDMEFLEVGRKKKIKRIIAAEGSIILGIILLGAVFIFQPNLIPFGKSPVFASKKKKFVPSYIIEFENGKTYEANLGVEKDYQKGVTCEELNDLAEGVKTSKNLPLDLKVKSINLKTKN